MCSKYNRRFKSNSVQIITGISESKTLTKHISCECKCTFKGTKCDSDQWSNNDKCWCECMKRHICEKYYVCNTATCNYENGKYLASVLDDSAVSSDEIKESYKEETKAIPSNFYEKKAIHKLQNFYILLTFLLITITLLIAVSTW